MKIEADLNPQISPSDAKIAPDWFCLRVPAPETIVVLWLNKHVPAGSTKTSEGASSAVGYAERAAV